MNIKKNIFHRFFNLILLRRFFSEKSMKCHENHCVIGKKLLVNGFRYLYHLHSCGFKLKGQQRYLRVTFVKLASWFRTPVSCQSIPHLPHNMKLFYISELLTSLLTQNLKIENVEVKITKCEFKTFLVWISRCGTFFS